jgi:hypothetical protein
MVDVRRIDGGRVELAAVTLDDLAREGARQMTAAALEAEVEQYVGLFTGEVDDDGKRLVVRNGPAAGAQADRRARSRSARRGSTTSASTPGLGRGGGSARGSCRPEARSVA